QNEQQKIKDSPLEGPENLPQQSELPRRAPRMGLAARRAFELERLRLRNQRAHGEDRNPVAGPRKRDFLTAGNEHRSLDTCHTRLRGAVEIRVQDSNPEPPVAQRAREMQCQSALADA